MYNGSIRKRLGNLVGTVLLSVFCLQPAAAFTAEACRTHSVFYAGEQNQAILRLCLTGQPGEKARSFRFSFDGTDKLSDIRCVRLFSSGSVPGFAPNADERLRAAEVASVKNVAREVTFNTVFEMKEPTQYVWLVLDLAAGAGADDRIEVACTEIGSDDGSVVPEVVTGSAVRKPRAARVYPFRYRIVPYYRPRWVKGWGNAPQAVHLTPVHFKCFTELIHFAYTVTAEGNVAMQWVGAGADATTVVDEALAEIRRLRAAGGKSSGLIAGFGHMDGPMTAAVADPATRRTLARNMAEWVISRGYRGVDIDWEYPDTPEQWEHFGYFLAALREELAGSGVSVSMAASVTYKVPTRFVTDQVDFLMTMSYDDLGAQHASMQRFQGDAAKCLRDFRMPKSRVVVGLPFYSNEKGKLTEQFGYSQIRSWYPRLGFGVNEIISKKSDGSDGPPHSFNGPDLIRDKCRWLKKERLGGVMIWAYDTDVPLTDKASLGRAVYSVLKQKKRGK